jgi:hypothetical protein
MAGKGGSSSGLKLGATRLAVMSTATSGTKLSTAFKAEEATGTCSKNSSTLQTTATACFTPALEASPHVLLIQQGSSPWDYVPPATPSGTDGAAEACFIPSLSDVFTAPAGVPNGTPQSNTHVSSPKPMRALASGSLLGSPASASPLGYAASACQLSAGRSASGYNSPAGRSASGYNSPAGHSASGYNSPAGHSASGYNSPAGRSASRCNSPGVHIRMGGLDMHLFG